ncbi:hypothetical protein MMC13_001779 [Lambiella insularis]|nr:hypothetical protein [Lambiella insularis]
MQSETGTYTPAITHTEAVGQLCENTELQEQALVRWMDTPNIGRTAASSIISRSSQSEHGLKISSSASSAIEPDSQSYPLSSQARSLHNAARGMEYKPDIHSDNAMTGKAKRESLAETDSSPDQSSIPTIDTVLPSTYFPLTVGQTTSAELSSSKQYFKFMTAQLHVTLSYDHVKEETEQLECLSAVHERLSGPPNNEKARRYERYWVNVKWLNPNEIPKARPGVSMATLDGFPRGSQEILAMPGEWPMELFLTRGDDAVSVRYHLQCPAENAGG